MSYRPGSLLALAAVILCAGFSRADSGVKNPCPKAAELKTQAQILAAAPADDPAWARALEKRGISLKDGRPIPENAAPAPDDRAFVAALGDYCAVRSGAPTAGVGPASASKIPRLLAALSKKGPDAAFGPLPVDNGASLRGYSLPGDGIAVAAPGRTAYAASLSADNYITEVGDASGRVVQKFENEKALLDVRRGIAGAPLPTEVGVQVRAVQRDVGVLNGFISGWEDLTAWAFHNPSLIDPIRSGHGALHGTIDSVTVDGRNGTEPGSIGARLGDVTVDVKTAVLRSLPGSFAPALAARAAVNIASGGPFTSGSWAGFGLSGQQRALGRLYANGDVRVTVPLSATDRRGLPLRADSVGTTAGLEYLLSGKTSLGLQLDRQSTPYVHTGVTAFDDEYGDVTFGVSRLVTLLGRKTKIQVWGKEDYNPDAKTSDTLLAPHGDTDFSTGIKASF